MGYGQRLRMQRSADGRVLKAQLNLIADVLQGAQLPTPLWTLAIALAVSQLPVLGGIALKQAMILPLVAGTVTLLG